MRIDADTPLWVVTDATKHSDLRDICFQTTIEGLRLQFAGGLSMDQRPVLFTDEEEAHEEAKNRLLVRRVAERIRIERRLDADEVVRITLHGEDGTVIWQGEVR
jgi:hypothetical protein